MNDQEQTERDEVAATDAAGELARLSNEFELEVRLVLLQTKSAGLIGEVLVGAPGDFLRRYREDLEVTARLAASLGRAMRQADRRGEAWCRAVLVLVREAGPVLRLSDPIEEAAGVLVEAADTFVVVGLRRAWKEAKGGC
jgi:inosine/xanthosine triphosphate pyrophosphatase family protein